MADSSSRFGLCITVRPGSHKAISVKDLRWRERSILIIFFGHLYIQWMLGYWSDVPNSSAPSLTAFLFWIEHSLCSFSGDDHKLWLFFINTTNNFSPGCHKLSPYWHTLHKTSNTVKDRKIQRYAGWRQPGMSFISLLYSPFTLCVFLASIPPERHDLKPYPECRFRCDSLFHVTALCMKS